MFYKKEVDGLRAIAVIAVIFYHASLQLHGYRLLPGGYLGVDVFFAISGFLIAHVLLHKQTPLWTFFKSRFDRIYPSLVLVLALSCAAAYAWLVPRDMLSFAATLKGALAFFSNTVFAAEDSYVSDSSHYKPLIHTWSLAVEWQFYCLIPFVLIGARKLMGPRAWVIILAALCGSLLAALHMVRIDQTRAFYLGIYRFWEMLAGVLLYVVWSRRTQRTGSSRTDAALAALSLLVIFLCMTLTDDKALHPGPINALVIACTCTFILFSSQQQRLGRCLSMKPIAWFGVISYTLYIVHQPVFAFYRIAFAEINNRSFVLLLALIVAISALIYYAWETPIRKSKHRVKYVPVAAAAFSSLAFAIAAQSTGGFEGRQPQAIRDALSNYAVAEFRRLQGPPGKTFVGDHPTTQCIHRAPQTACAFGDVAVITLGDSNVGMYEYSLQQALEKHGQGILSLSYEQCPVYADPIWSGNVPECWQINQARWKLLEQYESRPVIVVSANFHQFERAKQADVLPSGQPPQPVTQAQAFDSFNRSIDRLLALGYPVIVIADTPHVPFDVKKEVERRAQLKTWSTRDEYFDYLDRPVVESHIQQTRLHPGKRFALLRPDDDLCDANKQRCLSISAQGGLYNQEDHLSYTGVQRILPRLLRTIDTLGKSKH
ncbi:MAG: acyltransferase [Burkholderiaceae bacterium]|jgi:peptidoglycan/LPS O-acetylase OafA/YrhL|nr:acyltransferase [Burkholderiaceae bacterium]